MRWISIIWKYYFICQINLNCTTASWNNHDCQWRAMNSQLWSTANCNSHWNYMFVECHRLITILRTDADKKRFERLHEWNVEVMCLSQPFIWVKTFNFKVKHMTQLKRARLVGITLRGNWKCQAYTRVTKNGLQMKWQMCRLMRNCSISTAFYSTDSSNSINCESFVWNRMEWSA